MRKILSSLSLILVFLLVTSCSSIPPEKQCSVDTDCVPDACCHATGAIRNVFAPDCSGVICTLECRPETLDCGQGSVQCIKNECKAVFS
ncbi:hypothetical protein HYT55_01600 [Candidatus Woesearchaeota archaeon]|nr:hypothetical protein [Candidatus Woesearchaeota archaeon]